MNLRRVWAILFKDLIDITKSKTLIFALFAPIMLSVFFSFAFSTKDMKLPGLAIYDKDVQDSGFKRFIEQSGIFRVIEVDSLEKGISLIRERKVASALIISQGFTEQIKNNKIPLLELYIDNSLMRQAILVETGLNELLRSYACQGIPARIIKKKVYSSSAGPMQEILPVWIMLSIMGGLMVVTSSFVEEKEKKTLNALLVSPSSVEEIVISKVVLGSLLGFSGSLIILILNKGLTGDLVSIFLILILGSISFSLLGIVIGLISATQSTANAINSVIYLVCFVPLVLSDTSRTMSIVARYLPSYYVVDGLTLSMLATAQHSVIGLYLFLLGVFSLLLLAYTLYSIAHQFY